MHGWQEDVWPSLLKEQPIAASVDAENGPISSSEQSKESGADPINVVIMTYLPNFGVKQRILETLVW